MQLLTILWQRPVGWEGEEMTVVAVDHKSFRGQSRKHQGGRGGGWPPAGTQRRQAGDQLCWSRGQVGPSQVMVGFAPCGCGDLGISHVTVSLAKRNAGEVGQEREEQVRRHDLGKTSLVNELVMRLTSVLTSAVFCVFSAPDIFSWLPFL